MALSETLRTRLRQSPGLGGAPLGNLFRTLSDRTAIALVRYAHAAGARYFDTAPHYGHGRSERRVGDALRDFPRDDYLLSTKVGRLLEPRADAPGDQHGYIDTLPFVQRYDYTAKGVRRSLADSLQRLGLARIDLVYVHDIDRATHSEAHPRRLADALDGGFPALATLKAEGTIGGYGLGVNDVAICREVLRHADLDIILLAGRYTLADQSALPALLPALPAAALQFPLGHPAVTCVLPGPRSAAEFDENLRHARYPIPARFWRALRDQHLIDAHAPLPGEQPSPALRHRPSR